MRASIWIAATFKSKMGLQQSMPLDPQVKKLFSLMAVFPQPDIGKITPQQYREAADKASIQLSGEPEAIGGIEDKTIQGRNGGIRIRIYRPLNQRPPHKVVIYSDLLPALRARVPRGLEGYAPFTGATRL
ncbi:MAG: hypothetical protein RXO22_02785 [Thermocladium sp.]